MGQVQCPIGADLLGGHGSGIPLGLASAQACLLHLMGQAVPFCGHALQLLLGQPCGLQLTACINARTVSGPCSNLALYAGAVCCLKHRAALRMLWSDSAGERYLGEGQDWCLPAAGIAGEGNAGVGTFLETHQALASSMAGSHIIHQKRGKGSELHRQTGAGRQSWRPARFWRPGRAASGPSPAPAPGYARGAPPPRPEAQQPPVMTAAVLGRPRCRC